MKIYNVEIQLDDLMAIQSQLKIKFPTEFLEHYLKFNGGYPEKDKFLWADKNTTTINTFFSIKYEGFGNIESTYKNLVMVKKYLPKEILPFAIDDGGNFFCVSVRDKDYNYVYYCYNDHYNLNNNDAHLTLLPKVLMSS